jgi:NAD-dependent deacetylase
VWPAAGLPLLAREAGAYVVEINPEPTPLSDDADEVLRAPAGHALPFLAAAAGARVEAWA